MRSKGSGQKGTFGHSELPVATRYLYPKRRFRALLAAAALAASVVVVAIYAERLGQGELLSNGPLSSAHAVFEQRCDACHAGTAGVTDRACEACHERFGADPGVYSFADHYLYGSRDLARIETRIGELACRNCHGEHFGRTAGITRVPDARCLACHPFASFQRQHPEFDFAAEEEPDDDALRFPHIHHVRELLRTEGATQLEETCLRCHAPRPDGRGFEPIRFDAHCRDCHLPPTNPTPRLPVAGSLPGGLGVASLAALRREDPLGSSWLTELGGESFRDVPGNRLVKLPLVHADPWILENLRRLRRRLYEPGPLADLLATGATPPAERPGELEAVYAEAIAELEAYAAELGRRPQPELQGDLLELRRALARLAERVRDPQTPLDPAAFAVGEGGAPSAAVLAAGEELAEALTFLCVRCHVVERATIARVQDDQAILHRARFDHGAHVLQRGCLDCHQRIPFAEWLETADEVPAEIDRAAIQNLPGIDTCRACHGAAGAASRCVDCHLFHPDKERHGRLLVAAAGGQG